jgi:hypothetical protein
MELTSLMSIFNRWHKISRTNDRCAVDQTMIDLIRQTCVPTRLIDYCLNAELVDERAFEEIYENILWEHFSYVEATHPAQRWVLEALVLIYMIPNVRQHAKNPGEKERTRHIPFLAALAQQRLIRALMHFTPEDSKRLFEDLHYWSDEAKRKYYEWSTNFMGAVNVVRVIKAAILSRYPCQVYIPHSEDDVFGGIDLVILTPNAGMCLNVKRGLGKRGLGKKKTREHLMMQAHITGTDTSAPRAFRKATNVIQSQVDNKVFPTTALAGRNSAESFDTRVTPQCVNAFITAANCVDQQANIEMIPNGRVTIGTVKRRPFDPLASR